MKGEIEKKLENFEVKSAIIICTALFVIILCGASWLAGYYNGNYDAAKIYCYEHGEQSMNWTIDSFECTPYLSKAGFEKNVKYDNLQFNITMR